MKKIVFLLFIICVGNIQSAAGGPQDAAARYVRNPKDEEEARRQRMEAAMDIANTYS